MKKRKRSSKKKLSLFARAGILILVVIALLFTVSVLKEGDEEKKRAAPPEIAETVPPVKKLAIVIDDIGYDRRAVERLLRLEIPITLSVIPYCPYTEESARMGRQAGREIILHIPMEPHGYPGKNPGEGALLLSMTAEEIEDRIQHAMDSVPYITGANNHMGSRFMEDEQKVGVVLAQLKKRGLYFLDSCTTAKTKGKAAAVKAGIAYGTRDLFIDNSHDFEGTATTLKHIIEQRKNWETLIAIGHPYGSTLTAIEKVLPDLKAKGIQVVSLSEIIRH